MKLSLHLEKVNNGSLKKFTVRIVRSRMLNIFVSRIRSLIVRLALAIFIGLIESVSI